MTSCSKLIQVRTIALALIALLLAGGGHAQTYPSRSVRILTGYAPGGPTDVIGHALAQYLTQTLGQSFYAEAKPGLAGIIAGETLAKARPDGHTLYIAGVGLITVNHDLYPSMEYDPATAFAPITLLVNFPIFLEVSSKLPVNNLKEFIAYAKTGAKLNHGSTGVGAMPHLAAELFKEKVGFRSTHIPYKGSGPFANAMMAGEVQWAFDAPQTAVALVKGGFAKLLAVTWPQRYPSFPDTPTFTELGMPEFTFTAWFALVAPAKTPRAIIDKLHDTIAKGWRNPQVVAPLVKAGLDPATTTPEETAKIFAEDTARWGELVRKAHIKAQ